MGFALSQKYEYHFVRFGEGFWGLRRKAPDEYQDVVHEYARQGWRLVQVFAPGVGVYGAATHFDLIFEREVQV
jgi:hypothetical protein